MTRPLLVLSLGVTCAVAACGTASSDGPPAGADVAPADAAPVADAAADARVADAADARVADAVADAGPGRDADVTPDAAPDAGRTYADGFTRVHVDASVDLPSQLAVHACAGLYNRRLGGSVFVDSDDDVPQARIDGAVVQDRVWLAALGLEPARTVAAAEFLATCVADFGGCVRYDYATQHEILPSVLTVAAAEGVPPLSEGTPLACDAPVVDATEVFADKTTQALSTQYVYEHYLHRTTGLAMLNPGYDRNAADKAHPPLVEDMPVALVDFVFARRLFVVFLVNGCVDHDPEEDLLGRIVNESGWTTPVGVYGYNDSWLAGGYLYEAQTRCLPSANMGAIPSRTSNLSFFSTRRPPIEAPDELVQTPPDDAVYDPTQTYVAFVVGDGDNLRYIMTSRRDWLEQRLSRCRGADPACPPLTWTISPHLPEIAPDVLRWYFEAAATTGADRFMLPPSGYQYAYPGLMPPDAQARFAAGTERAAAILGAHGVIHWEWFTDWPRAVSGFLPRYAHAGSRIRGVFPVNVPYLVEAFPGWPAEKTYEILRGEDGGEVVLFRSQSWRGVDDSDDFHPSPQHMADRLAALPPGTVTWVYMTSDGGLTLENSYAVLTGLLPERVRLVSTDAAADLALQAGAR